jgi:hypothetical protein
VVAATLLVFLVLRVSDIGLVLAPALPFMSVGIADQVAEGRARRAAADR